MNLDSLWRESDERALGACRDAIERSDLVSALLAIEGASVRDIKRVRGQLGFWAEFVAEATHGSTAYEQASALKRVLGDEVGLKGTDRDYYNPANCDLSKVVTRKRGMPILLSAIWIAVGQRASFDVLGIGLPGHFIARVGSGDTAALCDPFRGGDFLTKIECRERVQHLTGGRLKWRDGFLDPVQNQQIAYRVLRNRAHCSQRSGDDAGRYRAARLLARLTPRELMHSVLEGQAAEAIGAHGVAAEVYERLAKTGGEPGRIAMEALERLGNGRRYH